MKIIAGIDESGNGAICGIIACAVVILPNNHGISVLPKDSKRMTKKELFQARQSIEEKAIFYKVETMSPSEVDKIGAGKAVIELWKRCAEAARKYELTCTIIVDGQDMIPGFNNQQAIIQADDKVPAVSAAAILARCACEDNMLELQQIYTNFTFTKHMGYRTEKHFEELKIYGLTPEHRFKVTEKFINSKITRDNMQPNSYKQVDTKNLSRYIEKIFALAQLHPEILTAWEMQFSRRMYLNMFITKNEISIKDQQFCISTSGKLNKLARKRNIDLKIAIRESSLNREISIDEVKRRFNEIMPHLRTDKSICNEWFYNFLASLIKDIREDRIPTKKQTFYFFCAYQEIVNNVKRREKAKSYQ